jgi:hypothetical protein
MTRRTWMLLSVTAMLTLSGGGLWAVANAGTSPKAVDCCLDPTCPGCFAGSTAASTKSAGNTSCCCDDPTCPPGCTPECAAECLLAAKTARAKAKKECPPCPFCP